MLRAFWSRSNNYESYDQNKDNITDALDLVSEVALSNSSNITDMLTHVVVRFEHYPLAMWTPVSSHQCQTRTVETKKRDRMVKQGTWLMNDPSGFQELLAEAGRWLITNGGRRALWFVSFSLRALYISSVSITTNLFTCSRGRFSEFANASKQIKSKGWVTVPRTYNNLLEHSPDCRGVPSHNGPVTLP